MRPTFIPSPLSLNRTCQPRCSLRVIHKLRWPTCAHSWTPTYPWLTFMKEFLYCKGKICIILIFPGQPTYLTFQRSLWTPPNLLQAVMYLLLNLNFCWINNGIKNHFLVEFLSNHNGELCWTLVVGRRRLNRQICAMNKMRLHFSNDAHCVGGQIW